MPRSESDAGEVMVAGLVPAAGASRRLGQDKRRLPHRESTVLEVTVDSLRLGGASPIVVVLEPRSPCRGLPGLAGTLVAVNTAPEHGMLSSIRLGLERIPPRVTAVAVLPGDHPFVPPRAVAALVRCFAEQRPLLLAPRYRGRRGHPLLLHRVLFAEAVDCDDAVGLRQLVQRRSADLLELELDEPVEAAEDVDLPEHLSRLKR